MSEQELIEEYGHWGEHEKYLVVDWQYEIENGNTRQSYWQWVAWNLDQED